jgi:uncharacterized membrane-anchored protein
VFVAVFVTVFVAVVVVVFVVLMFVVSWSLVTTRSSSARSQSVALLNVNANKFLAAGLGDSGNRHRRSTTNAASYMDPDNDTEEHHAESAGEADSGKYDTVNITLEYAAEL